MSGGALEKTTAGLGRKDEMEREASGRWRKSCLICRHTGRAASIQAAVEAWAAHGRLGQGKTGPRSRVQA